MSVGAATVGHVQVVFSAENSKLKRVARDSVVATEAAAMAMRRQSGSIEETSKSWAKATEAEERHTGSIRHSLPLLERQGSTLKTAAKGLESLAMSSRKAGTETEHGIRRISSAVGAITPEFFKTGLKAGASLLKGLFTPNPQLMETFSGPFTKVLATPIGLGLAAGIVGVLGPLLLSGIGVAITAGLGAGLIAAGALLLKDSPILENAVKKVGGKIMSTLRKAAEPMLQPFLRGLDAASKAFQKMGAPLQRIFAKAAEAIQPLVQGLLGLAQKALPGIERAMPGVVAALDAISANLPGLGKAVGDFFSVISENREGIARTTDALFTLANGAIKALAFMINGATDTINAFFESVATLDRLPWFGNVLKAIPWWRDYTAWVHRSEDANRALFDSTQPLASGVSVLGASVAATGKDMKTLQKDLDDTRKKFGEQVDAVKQSIESYQGLISQSKVTAKQVINDLHNQVQNFKTYAHDVHTLIKAGVNPAAIQELSKKGPEYVHALATGSNRELERYKGFWAARQKEIRTGFAKSMELQLADLTKKINAMQKEIDRLTGKNIPISASLKLNFSPSYTQKDWVRDRALAQRMAEGGLVTQGSGPTADDVLTRLSRGEFVVNAKAASAIGIDTLKRINRMALGGPVGQISTQTGGINKLEAHGTGVRFYQNLAAFLAMFGGYGGGGPLGPASGNVIRLALNQAKRMHASFKVALALIEAGIVESGLRNLNYGDRDSLGFLQQRPSQGWKHPMNITYASWDFLRRAIPIAGNYLTAGQLAQAVQRSAFPARYDAVQARALGILHAFGYDRGGFLPSGLSLAYNGTGRPEPVGAAAGNISIVNKPGTVQLTVQGSLDSATMLQVKAELENAFDEFTDLLAIKLGRVRR
jgi:hypothetical protein